MSRTQQPSPPAGTRNRGTPDTAAGRIRAALREQGVSVAQWAQAHGYPASTVYDCLRTWAHRTDRAPHGGQSARIMAQLKAELGEHVVTTPQRAAA
jgi:gp16 family phage-associated protein